MKLNPFFWILMSVAALGLSDCLPVRAQVVFSNLYSFSVGYGPSGGSDGCAPMGALAQGKDGLLYGTASAGGTNYAGTIFKFTTKGDYTLLHTFTGGDDGGDPQAPLVAGLDGNLYGTTLVGGTNNGGTIFEITADGAFINFYSFDGTQPQPQGRLVPSSDGFLYGTTFSGGTTYYAGSVFKIATNGLFTQLYAFTGGVDGGWPEAGLVQASDGCLYGETTAGGTNDGGCVFKITTNGTFTELYAFTGGNDGSWPQGGLLQAGDGKLYGTTALGGVNGAGTIFQITTNGALTVIYSLPGGNGGSEPQAQLVLGQDGNLFGLASLDGTNGAGAIFEITLDGTYTELYAFGGIDGSGNQGSLMQASDGNFYGTTSSGGLGILGSIFQLEMIQPPILSSLMLAGGTLKFSWQAAANQSYQVQYKTNLTEADWNDCGGVSTTTTNSILVFTDIVGPDAQRFYRVVCTP